MTLPQPIADALLLNCIDYRLPHRIGRYMEDRGLLGNYDHLVLAGAALAVVREDGPAWKQIFLEHVQIAINLHAIQRLIILDHLDCGAFKVFLGSEHPEEAAEQVSLHTAYLERARAIVQGRWPELIVELLVMDLYGVVRSVGETTPTTAEA